MFTWNIAKTAEAMFSKFAVKRLCKFLLKKKLGQFLLGEIDIDQLDVQLADGTIQLSDLALNVDFLNEKVGTAALVTFKEGSIGSLLIRMPWTSRGCEVEINGLELVLSPCLSNDRMDCCGTSSGGHKNHNESRKSEHYVAKSAVKSTYGDIHEGVKTVAKMVKGLLASFHVKIINLIVAFDSFYDESKNKTGLDTTLVLRISDVECGTCVTEDGKLDMDAAESFLGISQLSNFVKFQGAMVEFLHMDDCDNPKSISCMSAGTSAEMALDHVPSNVTIPVLTGGVGGFSGNLKLCIPLRDGSLDIYRVDGDLFIDPVQVKLQPRSIKCFLVLSEAYWNSDKHGDGHGCKHNKLNESGYFDRASHDHSFTLASAERTPDETSSPHCGGILPGSHLISNWVPSSVKHREKEKVEEEFDFGASVDQFFECLDEIRSSQSALGSSGVWNSVFSAITAASSLASGSLPIPCDTELQPVETNLRATISGISVVISFHDDNQHHSTDPEKVQIKTDSEVHFVAAKFSDIHLLMQVSQKTSFQGTIKHIEVADYLNCKNYASKSDFHNSNSDFQTLLTKHLQVDVIGALPPFNFSAEDPNNVESNSSFNMDFPCENKDNVTKITLLKTYDITSSQLNVISSSSGDNSTMSKSFSLNLPPFIFWVNYTLVNMLLDLLRGVANCIPGDNNHKCFKDNYVSDHKNVKSGCNQVTALSSSASVQGNIIIAKARVIFCFPFESDKDFMGYSSWDQFIALDFYSPPITKEETIHSGNLALQKSYFSEKNALHFRFGSLGVFLVTSDEEIKQGSTCNVQRKKFSAHNILSASNRTNASSLTFFWQEGHVTGPWIAKKAKSLASLEESESRCKFIGKDYEFASVANMKDMEESNLQTRQEMILSSTSVLHVFLPLVRIDAGAVQYKVFNYLLDQLIKGLSSDTCDAVDVTKGSVTSQKSIVVDCNCVEISIRPDSNESAKCSLQRELPGSWYHLRLVIQNFELISVSDLGSIEGANFFWLSHGEGQLLGFISEDPDQEFRLISCSNSNMKRGDGEGSNALSSRLAGCDIVHMWDPECLQDFSSITIRCATILAIGGRLDWLDVICSFFLLPSSPVEPEGDEVMPRENTKKSSGSNFFLNFVDVGLSYQPYLKNLLGNSRLSRTESSSSTIKQELDDDYVACLLAASSVTLSSSSVADTVEDNFRITIQDIGLLLCSVSDYEHVFNAYNVEDLRKGGWVKVARETFIEAILRTNCDNGLKWELECHKAHVFVETCNDTTTGLVRLAAQLQQLFAPDLEESIVHLQTRWNNVQQAQERKEIDNESSSPPCHNPSVKQSETGLMDEICEDAFLLNKNQTRECDCFSSTEGLHTEVCRLNSEVHETSSPIHSFIGSEPDGQTSFIQYRKFPEIIEGYCLSEFRPVSDLTMGQELPPDICNSRNSSSIDLEGRRSGWYGNLPIKILENHILDASKVEHSVTDDLCSIESKRLDEVEEACGRVLLNNIDLKWRMYAGSDWQVSRENGDRPMSMVKRDQHTCLELALSAMHVQYDVFPMGGMCVSRLSLSVQDFHLYDSSVDAPWKLVLGYYNSKNHPRKSSSKAFKLDLEAIRPDPLIPLEEYRLRVGFLPMLLHLHQCQLDFLVNFFGGKSSSGNQSGHSLDSDGSKTISTTKSDAGLTLAEEALLPYFQKFDIQPIVVRVDYSPSRVDLAALRGGKYVELVNLVPWKGVELHLKHVQAVGVYGWGSVCETVVGEWLEDISHNQIRKILEGLPTVRSLVAVGSGASKLLSSPVESYKKDRRILKGMQRGTIAFLRSISLEAIGLGVHLAAGAHDILLQAEYILTTVPPSVKVRHKTKANVRSNQPKDAQEGLKKAYESISDGLGKSASALVRTPLKKYQRGGSTVSALATAVQAIPAAAIAPASACASAIHYTFLGLRNSLDPERKRESMEKYLGPTDSWEQN
ncbi:autophagy-related protein 2 isoform X1 [Cucurbita pepo subsp. pepo]|uniref:autophagy-related protein 2 isoform X1 n=1 Tax=Cucurbita pepo subsp. pepo TaxID=3664 RepID=UPI000C9D5AB8|nr:autophagy-related protein 2 isoform X1 [Cucurbita pepo subsp. pepo]